MVTINDLEFVAILLNYAAACLAFAELLLASGGSFPVLLDFTDKISAHAWLKRPPTRGSNTCSTLPCLFAMLQWQYSVGINAGHIAGSNNLIPDAISCPPLAALASSSHLPQVLQAFPSLKGYQEDRPSSKLLSLVFSALFLPLQLNLPPGVPLGQLLCAGTSESSS